MLNLDIVRGDLYSQTLHMAFADRPYQYALSGTAGSTSFHDDPLVDRQIDQQGELTTVRGRFTAAGLTLKQEFRNDSGRLEETLTLSNTGDVPVTLQELKLGFVATLGSRTSWRLCAIPFRVQLDGSVHDYPTQALAEGQFHNAVYSDKTRPEPPLSEEGTLRSEAWAWGTGDQGLVIVKYNNAAIELSVAQPEQQDGQTSLRFGGAGFALYGEPSPARTFAPRRGIHLRHHLLHSLQRRHRAGLHHLPRLDRCARARLRRRL